MHSFLNALLGLPQLQQPLIYWGFSQNEYIHEAVRIGSLKAVRTFGQPTELFDLAADPFEAANVAGQYPDIIDQAEGIFNRVCIVPKSCCFFSISFGGEFQ